MEERVEYASVEAFERAHPALVGAMENAVRRELEIAQTNGVLSGDSQCPLDRCKVVSGGRLVSRDTQDCVSQCDECLVGIASHCGKFRVLSGVDRFPIVHMLTSLLVVSGAIVASLALAGKLSAADERKTVA